MTIPDDNLQKTIDKTIEEERSRLGFKPITVKIFTPEGNVIITPNNVADMTEGTQRMLDDQVNNQITTSMSSSNGQPVGITKRSYSDIAEEHLYAKSALEDKLLEFGFTDWDNLWTDPYDNSIELDGVDNENRLSPEAQKYLSDEGFSICWLTHKDDMETAYYKLEGEEGSRKKSHRTPKREIVEAQDIDVEIAIAEAIQLMPRDFPYEEKGSPVLHYLKKHGYKVFKRD